MTYPLKVIQQRHYNRLVTTDTVDAAVDLSQFFGCATRRGASREAPPSSPQEARPAAADDAPPAVEAMTTARGYGPVFALFSRVAEFGLRQSALEQMAPANPERPFFVS